MKIEKIISGGQTGADQAGLLAAEELGIQTGGTAPLGYRTETGVNLELRDRFGLSESFSKSYGVRTARNVVDSDATVILAYNERSTGTNLTIKLCRQHNKPYIVLNPQNRDHQAQFVDFLNATNPSIINIAGNRESVANGIKEQGKLFLVNALQHHIIPMEVAMDKSIDNTVNNDVTLNTNKEARMNGFINTDGFDIGKGAWRDYAIVQLGKKLSDAINPVSENDIKVRLVGLTPETVDVEGYVFYADVKEGEYIGCYHKKETITISVASPFAQWAIDKRISLITIKESNPNLRVAVYEDMQIAAFKQNRFIIGNAKKSDPIFGSASLQRWRELIGDDVRLYSNPNKPLSTFCTPENYKIIGSQFNGEDTDPRTTYARVLVVDDEFTEEGYPIDDGSAFTSMSVFYTQVGAVKEYQAQLEKYEAGKGKKPTLPKEKRVNASAQIRGYHVVDESDVAVYNAAGPEVVRFEVGDVLPSPKLKIYCHIKRFIDKCLKHGVNPNDCDMIMGISNFKTLKHTLKHGDIVMYPVSGLRFINIKVRDGKSSLGVQSVRLQHELVRQILSEHTDKAQMVVDALKGDVQAILDILSADTEASFEDIPHQILKVVASAIMDPSMPSGWRAALYKSQHMVLLSRIHSFLIQNVYKVRMFGFAAYLECNEELGRLENEHFARTGEWKYFFTAPSKNKISKANKKGVKWNIGRNPIVGSGNFMEFTLAGFNGTSDTIELSPRALFTMFGDVDGDTCIIFPHDTIGFPTVIRPAEPVKKGEKKESKPLPTDAQFADICIDAMQQIVKSANDTGNLDNLSRQILIERWVAGIPLTLEEIMEMGIIVQMAIDGMKHSDIKADEDAAMALVRKFGVKGKIKKLKDAPKEYIVLRSYGSNSSLRGLPAECMLNIVRNLKDITVSKYNPYQDIIGVLANAETKCIHEDSAAIRNLCIQEFAKITQQHNEALATMRRKGVRNPSTRDWFGWTIADLRSVAQELMYGSKDFLGHTFDGYVSEIQILANDPKLKKDKVRRREEFTEANKYYKAMLEDIATAVVEASPLDVKNHPTARREFMYQLMVAIGTRAFGVSTDQETGSKTSRSGSLFWQFPVQIIFDFFKRVNPDNPFFDVAQDAIDAYHKKQAAREAEEAYEDDSDSYEDDISNN